uniref:Uncharacterized protein n=1 Tax=Plectus sambesii TaxID=2011161 RepID=A0A914VZ31_9BILA
MFKGVINAHDVLVDMRLEVRGVLGIPLTIDVALRVPLQYNKYRSECLLYVMREANHPFLLGTDIFPLLGGLNNLLGGVNFAAIMGPTRPIATPDVQVAEARDLIHQAWQVLDSKDAINRKY